MKEILVLAAHPALENSRVTAALMHAARSQVDGDNAVAVRDLYALYPDFYVDVQAEQAALARADLLVWLHPVHWYGMPPLMKLWLDEVFTFGWAYGPGGKRLAGKDLWLVTSTGGPEDSYSGAGYNRYFFDAFLPPYDQTAALAGMRFLPPLVLHGAHRADGAEIERHASMFAQRLARYPDWPEIDALPAGAVCNVPADARPAEAALDRVAAN
jgi:glutathione-regulated potassium-efflux system ancillary protein KefF